MKKPTETKTTLVIPMDFLKQQQQQQQPQQWNSCINSKWHELQNLSYVLFLKSIPVAVKTVTITAQAMHREETAKDFQTT